MPSIRHLPRYAAVLLLCAACYYLGGLSARFSANRCYNQALVQITTDVKAARQQPTLLPVLTSRLDALPLRGYESDCQAIVASLAAHPD